MEHPATTVQIAVCPTSRHNEPLLARRAFLTVGFVATEMRKMTERHGCRIAADERTAATADTSFAKTLGLRAYTSLRAKLN